MSHAVDIISQPFVFLEVNNCLFLFCFLCAYKFIPSKYVQTYQVFHLFLLLLLLFFFWQKALLIPFGPRLGRGLQGGLREAP